MQEGDYVPNVNFMIRTHDPSGGDANPYRWATINSYRIFNNNRSILFALPGAFTPTCTERQVPEYDRMWYNFQRHGITQILCLTVNDYWTVRAWANQLNTKHVKFIPDGNGTFTQQMGMLVDKSNYGYGYRSWRYAAIINNSRIEKIFEEPGKDNNIDHDPYSVSNPLEVIKFLDSQTGSK